MAWTIKGEFVAEMAPSDGTAYGNAFHPRLGITGFHGNVRHVVGDDGGDDAAFGDADDSALCKDQPEPGVAWQDPEFRWAFQWRLFAGLDRFFCFRDTA